MPIPQEKVVFDFAMESMLRMLGRKPTPSEVAELVALGVDPSKPLKPAYTAETMVAAVDWMAKRKWPTLPPDEAQYQLGRAYLLEGYSQTLMGKAVVGMARVIGPHRILERMSRNFRTATNFTETKLTQKAPTTYELWFSPNWRPNYYRGIIHSGLEMVGVKSPEVVLISHKGTETIFRISWKE